MVKADLVFHIDGAIAVADARALGAETPPDTHPRARDLAWSTMFALPYAADEDSFGGWRRTAEKLRADKQQIIAEAAREIAIATKT